MVEDNLTERVFDLARFWRVSPKEIDALSIREFAEWQDNAIRIAEQQREAADGQ